MKTFLDTRIQQFLQERRNIEIRRKLWHDSVKKILEDHLNYCVKMFNDVGWYVSGHNDQENHESIYLAIGNVPSGIKDKDGKLLMSMGGAIHFSQIHNGKIRIWMQYPYIQDIAYHDPDYEVFEDIEPKDLDTDKIENFIAQFLQKQVESKSDEKPRPIGFH